MTKLISPWTNASFRLPSPDGKWIAVFENYGELGMGAPSTGNLYIEPWHSKTAWDGLNPAMTWSDDSQYLAVAQWAEDRSQRLLLVLPEQKRIKTLDDVYRVLEFHSFSGGVLRGIDSSGWQPRTFEVDVASLAERGKV
jgi:hypothetical protein